MEITSLGWRTDLEMLRLGGSQFEDQGDYLAVRTPHNPTFWWGNFLLLSAPPPRDDFPRWLDTFRVRFPEAAHVAMGFDGVDGQLDQLSGFTAAGMTAEVATVMTARSTHAPARPDPDAVFRRLSSDDDWEQQVLLRFAHTSDDDDGDPANEQFARAKTATARAMVEAGHGGWFGAFVGGRLVSSMGLFKAGDGLARFQSVGTLKDYRRRGLAGTLVHFVSSYGFDKLDAHTLVMIVDPTYSAIRLYRSLGFDDTERQLQVELAPAQAT
ncbi:MAG: GNAT family N-acetyltransferase [Nocardioidaceae bacterium]